MNGSFPRRRKVDVVAAARADVSSFAGERESGVVAPAKADVSSFAGERESRVVAPAKAGAQVAMAFRCFSAIAVLALGLASIWPQYASARTLAEIRARGTIAMCANPDALPHASKREDLPGFQIEIGRALTQSLGPPLEVDWIIPRMRASLVDCDILSDTSPRPESIADRSSFRIPARRAASRSHCVPETKTCTDSRISRPAGSASA